MAKNNVYYYAVSGRWPFPLDMLRYDDSSAATPADQEAIDSLSVTYPEKLERVQIALVHVDASRTWKPTSGRWKSFMWRVIE